MSEKIFKETNLRSVVKVMSWRISVTISHLINGFIVSGFSNGLFTVNIEGLEPNTQYYVRAFASNTGSVGYGDVLTFTTLDSSLF